MKTLLSNTLHRWLVLLMGLTLTVAYSSITAQAASSLAISSVPLAGMGASYGPNVLFGLSVEYPTAGAAFNTSYTDTSGNLVYSETQSYLTSQAQNVSTQTCSANSRTCHIGYFDPLKCYQYNSSSGYFYPSGSSSGTTRKNGVAYTCTGAWSGDLLNWVTMTAIDIFRATLTGGNRALGTTGTSSDYSNGDTTSFTSLRHAAVVSTQNGGSSYYLIKKPLSSSNSSISSQTAVGNLTPFNSNTYPYLWFTNGPDSTTPNATDSQTGAGGVVSKPTTDSNYWTVSVYGTASDSPTFSASNMTYLGTFNVIAQVCTTLNGVSIENGSSTPFSCTQYGKNYKPEGLIQTTGTNMKFGVFSYLNNSSDDAQQGGVLRARLKYPGISAQVTANSGTTYSLGAEWDSNGLFAINPDSADSAAHSTPGTSTISVNNSGVINYLNKFGDGDGTANSAGYKSKDPAAELYYAALRYYRNMTSYPTFTNSTHLTSSSQAGFPVITDWEDPILNSCQKNFIIYIGDTNTHVESDIPGGSGQTYSDDPYTSTFNVSTLTQKIGSQEGVSSTYQTLMMGTTDSAPPYISGLAWWANTNNIRTNSGDTKTAQVKAFMIDVVENGNYKGSSGTWCSGRGANSGFICNAFYWAAKYGGFTSSTLNGYGQNPISSTTTPTQPSSTNTSEWLDSSSTSASSSSYISAFPNGKPSNYAPANNPTAMINALNSAFSSVTGAIAASQAALSGSSTNTDVISSSSYVYQSAFNSNDWSGDLIAYTLSLSSTTAGTASVTFKPAWRAQTTLETQLNATSGVANRNVLTYDQSTFSGVAFNTSWFDKLPSTTQKSALNSTDGKGDYRVNYLRGDKTQEVAGSSPQFRARTYRLGDIVHSTAIAIPTPSADPYGCSYDANLSGTPASTDRSSIFTRPAAVAVAANDGLLHIFNTSGTELAAYLPASIYSKLPNLTSTSYTGTAHQYFNDGSPLYAEACFTLNSSGNTLTKPEARSVLVGTTGAGGTSVYVLDVTHTNSITSSNVLWEFSASDDTALGYSIGSPRIVKLHNGRPAVIFGNGYNQTGNSGKASLIIAYLDKPSGASWDKGGNYFRIDLPSLTTAITSPNGLSSPATVDTDGDGIVDYVYAGDLNGNIWKFDLTSSSTSNWGLAYGSSPLFTACSTVGCSASALQAITSPPVITRDPLKGYLVLFGTGQYLSGNDLNQATTQALYGIRDAGAAVGNTFTATLLRQTINSTATATASSTTYYNSSSNNSATYLPSTYNGWYLPMTISPLANARVVTKPTLYRNTLAMFTAVIPNSSTTNVCTTGSTAIISLGYATGNTFTTAIYDTSGNGLVDSTDQSSSIQIASGINPGANYLVQLSPGGTTYNCTIGSGGAVACTAIANYSSNAGRLSWREIIQSW